MTLKLILTEDGSHSLYNPELKEIYHSQHGALAESRHVYLEAGFNVVTSRQQVINILEVGFGTGLNTMLTATESNRMSIEVEYWALEPYPLDHEIIEKLNYPGLFPDSGLKLWKRIHRNTPDRWIAVHPGFRLKKVKAKLEDYRLPADHYHLVYFDAFAPDVQPELWTAAVFRKLFDCMTGGALLVTYSARGAVRRNMQAAGFTVERLPGPAGKREMLRALKTP